MEAVVCPGCVRVCGCANSGTVLVWGECPHCGTRFTSMGGLNAKIGWVPVGCWNPPNFFPIKPFGVISPDGVEKKGG